MARLVGVDLPRDKRMEVALTYIFGIGRTRSNEILAATGIDRDMRTKDLTDEQHPQLNADLPVPLSRLAAHHVRHGGRTPTDEALAEEP